MSTLTPNRGQLIDAVSKLPLEVLPELASFFNYLQFNVEPPPQTEQEEKASLILSYCPLPSCQK